MMLPDKKTAPIRSIRPGRRQGSSAKARGGVPKAADGPRNTFWGSMLRRVDCIQNSRSGRKFVLLAISLLLAFCSGNRLEGLRKERAELRAYDGAPPVIPHKLKELGRQNCLHCHNRGDAQYEGKLATVTPHPEYLNCRQCHLKKQTGGLFQENDYVAYRIPQSPKKAQPLGPPYIPHRLQNRENCRACHLSKTSRPEITPRHGERTNCLQCHVVQDASAGNFPKAQKP